MTIKPIFIVALAAILLVPIALQFGANAGGNGTALSDVKYRIEVGVAQQGDQLVIAVVDSETGRVRSCFVRGQLDKPECSEWSD